MSELDDLKKENLKLKARIKLLQKRLAKFRKKTHDMEEEIEELDSLAEIRTTLNTPNKPESRCPKCGRELEYHALPFGELVLCSNKGCQYHATNNKREKKK